MIRPDPGDLLRESGKGEWPFGTTTPAHAIRYCDDVLGMIVHRWEKYGEWRGALVDKVLDKRIICMRAVEAKKHRPTYDDLFGPAAMKE